MIYVNISARPKAGGPWHVCVKNYPVGTNSGQTVEAEVTAAILEAHKLCSWNEHEFDIEMRHSETP